jgi:hypothetical protein
MCLHIQTINIEVIRVGWDMRFLFFKSIPLTHQFILLMDAYPWYCSEAITGVDAVPKVPINHYNIS